jgi:O-antigen ligase
MSEVPPPTALWRPPLPAPAAAGGPDVAAPPAVRPERTGFALGVLYAMWIIILFDPQWWIASYGPSFVLKLPTLMFAVLLALTLMKGPRRFFPPLLAFLVYMIATLPFAYVFGRSFAVTKLVFGYYVMALATLTMVKDPRAAARIALWTLMISYTFWVVIGAKNGLVPWHYSYDNYDGFGPLMLVGMAGSFYMGMAVKNRRLRLLGFLTAGGCIVGLVSSFARGAVLSAGVVALWVWVRSRHKVKTTILGVLAVVVLAVSADLIRGSQKVKGSVNYSNFWQEMASSFNKKDPTRTDREVLWHLAWIEYTQHPLFGVGPECFGAYAADYFAAGTTGGSYNDNPKTLWGRAIHNTYYQLLSEFGTVGTAIFLWMLWDFFKRNRALRKPGRVRAWAAGTGGTTDLRYVSLALEASMLGWLVSGYFYNQIFSVHWFYTMLTLNALLYQVTRPKPNGARPLPA